MAAIKWHVQSRGQGLEIVFCWPPLPSKGSMMTSCLLSLAPQLKNCYTEIFLLDFKIFMTV